MVFVFNTVIGRLCPLMKALFLKYLYTKVLHKSLTGMTRTR